MGIFKSIGNFVKKIAHGFRDVFRKVREGFSKLMGNKFFRGAMLAVSLFTGGVALIGALNTGGLGAAANLIVGKAVSIVTSPLKFIAKGLSGSGFESLASFGDSLTRGLTNFQDKASSLFTVAVDPTGGIAPIIAEDAGLTDLAGSESTSPIDIIDVDVDKTGLLDEATGKLGPGDYEASGFKPPDIPEPGSESLYPGASDLDVSQIDKLDAIQMEAPTPEGLDIGSGIRDSVAVTEDKTFFQKAGGVLKSAYEAANDNPVATNLLMSGLSKALGEDQESPGESLRKEFLFRNNMFRDNPTPSGINIRSAPDLRNRSRRTSERGQAARQQVRARSDAVQRPLTVGDAAGFGFTPKVYKPIFTGGG